jgi:hypothetical protein
VKTVTKKEIYPLIRKHVVPGSVIYTDEFRVYDGVSKIKVRGGQGGTIAYRHGTVRHADGEYVRGDGAYQFGRRILDAGQNRNSRSVSLRFAETFAESSRRIQFPIQSPTHGKPAVQVDFGAGFVEGELIALPSIRWNASRVMGRIFFFVSSRGFNFLSGRVIR